MMRQVLTALGITAACAAPGWTAPKPPADTAVAERLEAALNAGKADEAAGLFADDATVKDPFGGSAAGKEQIRAWIGGLIARHYHADSGNRQAVDGGTVRWSASVSDDRLRALKIAPLEMTGEATVRGGRIVSYAPRLPAASRLKLRDAGGEANKAVVRELIEQGFAKGNMAALDQLLAANFVDHDPFPGQPGTAEGVKAGIAALREAFPDLSAAVDDVVAEGDLVAARFSLAGTNTGPFAGSPPTGKSAIWSAVHVFRMADGKIAETWGVADRLGLRAQLGLVPPPAVAGKTVPASSTIAR